MEAINAAKGRKAEAYGMQQETDVGTNLAPWALPERRAQLLQQARQEVRAGRDMRQGVIGMRAETDIIPKNAGKMAGTPRITVEYITDLMDAQTAEKKRIGEFYENEILKNQQEINEIVNDVIENGISYKAYQELGPIYTNVYDPETKFFKRVKVMPDLAADGKYDAQYIQYTRRRIEELHAKIDRLEKERDMELREAGSRLAPFRRFTLEETQTAIELVKAYTAEDGRILSRRDNIATREEAIQRQKWMHHVLPALEGHRDRLIARDTVKAWGSFDCMKAAEKMAAEITLQQRAEILKKDGSKTNDPRKNRAGAMEISRNALPPSVEHTTKEHIQYAVDILEKQEKEWESTVKQCDGPSYDPLLPIANEKLERYLSIANTGRYPDEMVQSAWKEYAAIPILLTEETLTNPFAIPCADLLSLRAITNQTEVKQIKESVHVLSRIVSESDDFQVRTWAAQVRGALMCKIPEATTGPAVMNELLMDTQDLDFSVFASGYDDYHRQYAYFSSVEAIKKANPNWHESAANMTSAITKLISAREAIRDIFAAEKPMKELIKLLIKEIAPELVIGKMKEYITPD